MDGLFTYFLSILLSSVIVFSFRIKENLETYSDLFKDKMKDCLKKIKKGFTTEQKHTLDEFFNLKINTFDFCLKKIKSYTFHSFYLIFLFGGIGLISQFGNNYTKCTKYSQSLELVSIIFAIFLLYFLLRGIFTLICCIKIDRDKIDFLVKKIENKSSTTKNSRLNNILIDKPKHNVVMTLKKVLFISLFIFFILQRKEFKQLFYSFYEE